jgi:hypothetical protein
MAYKVDKRRKVVEVAGVADLDAIVAKVAAHGGTGWRIVTYITAEQVAAIAETLGDAQEPQAAPIGFRLPAQPQEMHVTTGLPFSPPEVEPE